MHRLSIPLGRTSTVRHSRRTVWLWGGIGLAWILFSFFVIHIWFARDTLSQYAPEETVFSLYLHPSAHEWSILLPLLGNTPLFPERSLTLTEITPYTDQGLALFFLKDGSRVIILHVPATFPFKTADQYGISYHEVAKNVYLFSSGIISNRSTKPSGTRWSLFPWRGLGHALAYDAKNRVVYSGPIRLSNKKLTINLPPEKGIALPFTSVPDDVAGAMTFANSPFPRNSAALEQLDRLLAPLGPMTTETILNLVESNGGMVLFSAPSDINSSPTFLLSIPFSEKTLSFSTDEFLKTVGAIKHPVSQRFLLPDGEYAQELIVDKEAVSIREQTIGGKQVFETALDNGKILVSKTTQELLISNKEELLEAIINKTNSGYKMCTPNASLFLRPPLLPSLFSSPLYRTEPIFPDSFTFFKEISLTSHKHSSTMTFCF